MRGVKLFRLDIVNLGPYTKSKTIETKNMFIEIREPTARGKTTIARILYAFLTGHVDTSLLTKGAEKGTAKLLFKDREYNLVISSNFAHVDKILDEPYSEFLVLTEGTPLYSFYVSPPRQIDLEELVKRFVPQPPEMVRLEAEMRRLEPTSYDIDKLIKTHQTAIEEKRKELERLEEELKKIDEELSKAIDMEKVKPIFEKQRLEDQVKTLEEEIKRLEDEHTRLLTEIQGVDYDELKARRRDLADRIEYLYRRLDMIEIVLNSFEKLKDALDGIRRNVDVLLDFNIPLFGQLVDPDVIEIWINDVEAGIETLTAKKAEIRKEIDKLESEKSRIESILEQYIKKHQRVNELESTINRRRRELVEARYRLATIERRVRELEQELGMSEEEIIKKALESQNVDKLMTKRRELVREIESVKTVIRDLEVAIERAKKMREEIIENKKKYDELKKMYNELKNEWTRKKKVFRETFKQAFKEVFKNIKIPDFDPETMTLYRPPHTYSQGERLLITIAYQYALVSALKAVGYEIPMVVIDLIVPIDDRYESEIKRVYRNVDTFRLILKTTNESGISAII